MHPFGILLGMEIYPASNSSSDTIRAERPAIGENSSSGPVSASFFEPTHLTPSSSGDMSGIDMTSRRVSTARSSATKARIERRNSFDKRTQSLITFGLVRGTTPSSIRKRSGAAIRDFASLPLVGGGVAGRAKGFSFSSASVDTVEPSGAGADGTKSGYKSDLHPGYVPPGGDA